MSSGTNNSHVSVAGISTGWVAVWQSGNNVVVRPVDATGAPDSPATTVQAKGHTGASPTAASVASGFDNAGAFAFAWADQNGSGASAVYVQRFGSNGYSSDIAPILVSQTSNGSGEVTPFIAASPALGGSYVVTWVDQGGSGQVRARLLAALAPDGGSPGGYLTNATDGTTGEFVVNLPTTSSRTRTSPTVAVGGGSGGSGYMAFGWADNTKTEPFGIIARRFPLPTQ